MASKGLGPLPRRRGSALAHGCVAGVAVYRAAAGEGGRRVNPLGGIRGGELDEALAPLARVSLLLASHARPIPKAAVPREGLAEPRE